MKCARTLASVALAAATVGTALGQEVPCLGAFERVAPAGGTAPRETLVRIGVGGPFALAYSVEPLPVGTTAPDDTRLHAFERLAPTGSWTAVESFPLEGLFGAVSIDGGLAAVSRDLLVSYEVAVLERDPATGRWAIVFAIPVPIGSGSHSVSGDRVAVADADRDVVQVWSQDALGGFVLEDEVASPVASSDGFGGRLHLLGERLCVTFGGAFHLFDRRSGGTWSHVRTVETPPDVLVEGASGPAVLSPERIVCRVRPGDYSRRGFATWRLVEGPNRPRAYFDGAYYRDARLGTFRPFSGDHVARGTAVQEMWQPRCGYVDPAFSPLAVFGTGHLDVLAFEGYVCRLAGFAGPRDAEDVHYDGRTIAVVVPLEVGAPRNNVHFASFVASELDRDRNCVEDAEEIAQSPELDRNRNGRLDATESRGEAFCRPPGPNSTGATALLRLVGSEILRAEDLAAVAEGLPAHGVGVLVGGRAPGAPPPAQSGAWELCVGGADPARYGAVLAGPDGAAARAIDPRAIPLASGVTAALAGESWAWQLVYRDGVGVAATSAAAIELR